MTWADVSGPAWSWDAWVFTAVSLWIIWCRSGELIELLGFYVDRKYPDPPEVDDEE